MGEVCAQDLGRGSCLAAKGKRHVASSAAQVEYADVRARQKIRKCTCSTAPPQSVHIERENVVQEIVSWRDGGEHLLHRARGGLLVGGAFWGGADYGGFGWIAQWWTDSKIENLQGLKPSSHAS